jgi:integrase
MAKGLSARSVLHCHRVLKSALAHAIKWQLTSRNPADAVDPPTPSRYEVKVVEAEEVKALLAAADETRYGSLINLAVMTGLRVGELLGLRWKDLDFDNRMLSVRPTCQWLPREGFIFRQPKTYRSTRPVSLGSVTIDRLRQQRIQQLEERLAAGPAYADKDLVFADPIGRPLHPSTLRQAWLAITKTQGLKLRLHDLRHIHASLLLHQGVHPKVVSERLGHSTVGITLDLYSHVTPTLQAQAAEQIESLLANG